MKTSFFYNIFDIKLKNKYIGYGKYFHLIDYFDNNSHNKLKFFLEKIIIKIFFFFKIKSKFKKNSLIKKICSIFTRFNKISSFLFLYTGYYKDTFCLGYFISDHKIYFIKIFRFKKNIELEFKNLLLAKKIFSKYFDLPKIVFKNNHVLCYDFIDKNKYFNNEILEKKLISSCKFSFIKYKKKIKFTEYINIKTFHRIDKFGCKKDNYLKFLTLKKNIKKIEVCLGHGDFTSWNFFINNKNKKISLVDFERLNYDVVYSDFFHYKTQNIIIKKRINDIKNHLNLINEKLNLSLDKLNTLFFLYNLKQLEYDLISYYEKKFRNHQLISLIKNRIYLIENMNTNLINN